MWNRVDRATAPTGEIVQVMYQGGMEGFGLYRRGEWWEPTEQGKLKNTPLYWKRMGQ